MSLIHLMCLEEALALYPGKVSVSTLKRRIREGKNGIKLRAVSDGRRLFTTQEWIEEFLEAQSQAAGLLSAAEPPASADRTQFDQIFGGTG